VDRIEHASREVGVPYVDPHGWRRQFVSQKPRHSTLWHASHAQPPQVGFSTSSERVCFQEKSRQQVGATPRYLPRKSRGERDRAFAVEKSVSECGPDDRKDLFIVRQKMVEIGRFDAVDPCPCPASDS
jgi:hypothetical protein